MELASMLAGEPFTDHPRAVCPIIATVLRAYNDALDDDRRQDLYRYAAASVGTRTNDRAAREARFDLCLEFFGLALPRWRLPFSRLPMRTIALAALRQGACATDESHRATLELIDRLIRVSAPQPEEPALIERPLDTVA